MIRTGVDDGGRRGHGGTEIGDAISCQWYRYRMSFGFLVGVRACRLAWIVWIEVVECGGNTLAC